MTPLSLDTRHPHIPYTRRQSPPVKTYDWSIVGAGPQGTEVFVALRKQGIPAQQIAVIDPNPHPLFVWERRNHNIGNDANGQTVDRTSPLKRPFTPPKNLGPLHRQGLPVTFSSVPQYIRRLREESHLLGIQDAFIRSTVEEVEFRDTPAPQTTLQLSHHPPIHAKHLVFSPGFTKTAWPQWAKSLKIRHPEAPLFHTYDVTFNLQKDLPKNLPHVAIIGSGATAIRLAEHLTHVSPNTHITLISRRTPVDSGLDDAAVPNDWVPGNGALERFVRQDLSTRLNILKTVPHSGESIGRIYDLYHTLQEDDRLSHVIGDIDSVEWHNGTFKLTTQQDKTPIVADAILLSTGFSSQPGGQLFQKLGGQLNGLSVQHGKFALPITNDRLEWLSRTHPQTNVFAAGPLSGLEVGPNAGRILGNPIVAKKITQKPSQSPTP